MMPKMLDRLTMWASRWRARCGRNARVECTTPQKLMSISQSICAWSISLNWPSRATPALLTTMLSPGWAKVAACAKAAICCGSLTSTRWTVTFCGAARPISSAVACSPASSRSASARSQPRAASSSASARPMPPAAPVTAAADPRIVVIEFQLHVGEGLRGNPYTAARLWQPGDVHACARFTGVRRRAMARAMSLSFLLTSLIVIVSPGTGVLYTLAVALTRGSRASIAAAFGCTLGIVPHICAAMLGLAAVLHTSALAFAALKWCGVIYLLVMAWQALRERGALAVDARLDRRSGKRVIVTGFLINILNPKLSIFFLAFLPQFVAANEGHPLLRMLELSGAFMAMTFAVFLLYGLFAASVRDRIVTRPRVMTWLRRAFAGGFAALGARLAFAER